MSRIIQKKHQTVTTHSRMSQLEIAMIIIAVENFREKFENYKVDEPSEYPIRPSHALEVCDSIIEKLKEATS